MYDWGDNRRYNSYAAYFRRHFGERVQKVAINAGFTCPNRDGKVGFGGCTFCNNEAFTPSYCQPSKSITQQIEEGIEFLLLPSIFPSIWVFFNELALCIR